MVLCAALVVGSLLSVAGTDAYLTQGQVRLTRMQQELTSVSGTHRDLEARLAQLSNPSAVVSQAEGHGLSAPSKVTDLPQVTVAGPPVTPTRPAPTPASTASTTGR
jgi:hypothetical protein